MKDFIDNLKIGAIVVKKAGNSDKNKDVCKGKKRSRKSLIFSDIETHKKFVACMFSAVKGDD